MKQDTYYSRNRDKILENQKAYNAEHKEAINTARRAAYKAKQEELKQKRTYYQRNRQALIDKQTARNKAARERTKAHIANLEAQLQQASDSQAQIMQLQAQVARLTGKLQEAKKATDQLQAQVATLTDQLRKAQTDKDSRIKHEARKNALQAAKRRLHVLIKNDEDESLIEITRQEVKVLTFRRSNQTPAMPEDQVRTIQRQYQTMRDEAQRRIIAREAVLGITGSDSLNDEIMAVMFSDIRSKSNMGASMRHSNAD